MTKERECFSAEKRDARRIAGTCGGEMMEEGLGCSAGSLALSARRGESR
ncbi:MAG: hypothetical protein ABW189_07635 [Rickettsiales bacterium]